MNNVRLYKTHQEQPLTAVAKYGFKLKVIPEIRGSLNEFSDTTTVLLRTGLLH
jgi:hypothetical protein